jgi:hypothetical protein
MLLCQIPFSSPTVSSQSRRLLPAIPDLQLAGYCQPALIDSLIDLLYPPVTIDNKLNPKIMMWVATFFICSLQKLDTNGGRNGGCPGFPGDY